MDRDIRDTFTIINDLDTIQKNIESTARRKPKVYLPDRLRLLAAATGVDKAIQEIYGVEILSYTETIEIKLGEKVL